jgi:hypothetical protein
MIFFLPLCVSLWGLLFWLEFRFSFFVFSSLPLLGALCTRVFWGFSHNRGTPKGLSHTKDYNSQNSNMNYFFFSILDLKFKIPNEFYEL